jgi:hypothetical protein
MENGQRKMVKGRANCRLPTAFVLEVGWLVGSLLIYSLILNSHIVIIY